MREEQGVLRREVTGRIWVTSARWHQLTHHTKNKYENKLPMQPVPFVKYTVQNILPVLLVSVSTSTTLAGSDLVMNLKRGQKHHAF